MPIRKKKKKVSPSVPKRWWNTKNTVRCSPTPGDICAPVSFVSGQSFGFRQSQGGSLWCMLKVAPASSKASRFPTSQVPRCSSSPLANFCFAWWVWLFRFPRTQFITFNNCTDWQQKQADSRERPTLVPLQTTYTPGHRPCSKSRCLQGTVMDYDYT